VISDCDAEAVVAAAGASVERAWDDVEGGEEDWVSVEILDDEAAAEDAVVTDDDEKDEEEEEEVPKPPIL
jgi:hypothetical protein